MDPFVVLNLALENYSSLFWLEVDLVYQVAWATAAGSFLGTMLWNHWFDRDDS